MRRGGKMGPGKGSSGREGLLPLPGCAGSPREGVTLNHRAMAGPEGKSQELLAWVEDRMRGPEDPQTRKTDKAAKQ